MYSQEIMNLVTTFHKGWSKAILRHVHRLLLGFVFQDSSRFYLNLLRQAMSHQSSSPVSDIKLYTSFI